MQAAMSCIWYAVLGCHYNSARYMSRRELSLACYHTAITLMRLPAGTVIPGKGNAYIVASVPGFKGRQTSPRGGEGLFLLPLPSGQALPAGATQFTVVNGKGETVGSSSV
jgi:hypothetical protein